MTRLLSALLLATTPALALEPAECFVQVREDRIDGNGVTTYIDRSTGPVVDLGGGMVATRYGDDGGDFGEEGMTIDHCASGRGFRVITRLWGTDSSDMTLDQDPIAYVQAAQASSKAFSLEDLASTLRTGMLYGPDGETCGCAAFYPELRGDRSPAIPGLLGR